MTLTDAELGLRISQWRTQRGLSQAALAMRVGLDQPKLSRIEAGERRVSSLELADLADALGVDPLDLLQDRPLPESAVAAARGGTEAIAVDSSAIDAAVDVLRTWRLLVDDGFAPHLSERFVPSPRIQPLSDIEDGKAVAHELRAKINNVDGPIDELISVATELGLVVVYRPLGHPCDGACVADGDRAVAVINSSQWGSRQRFTLAHEIGHWILGDVDSGPRMDRDVLEGSDYTERRANAFAASFLISDAALVQLKGADLSTATRMAYEYGVSLKTLGWRIHNDLPSERGLSNKLRRAKARVAAATAGCANQYQADSDARGRTGITFEFILALSEALDAGALSRRHVEALTGLELDPVSGELIDDFPDENNHH